MYWKPRELTIALRVADTTLLAVMLLVATLIYPVEVNFEYIVACLAAALAFQIVGDMTGLYGSSRSHTLADEALRIALSCMFVGAVLASAAFLTKTSSNFSRVAMLAWGGLAFVGLLAQRAAARYALSVTYRNGKSLRPTAVIGQAALAQAVAERIARSPWLGLRVTGFFTFAQGPENDAVEGAANVHELVAKCREGEVDHVYIALSAADHESARWLIRMLADTTASVYVAPDPFISELQQASWTNMDGLPIVSIYETPFNGIDGMVKRVEDLLLSVVILSHISSDAFDCAGHQDDLEGPHTFFASGDTA